MKKWLFMIVCCFIFGASFAYADNEKPIPVNQLPSAAQALLSQHFADSQVALAKMETEFLSKTYEVIFANGDRIDFDARGAWMEIDCKFSSVPVAIVPVPIQDYVRANYPDATILKLEKDRREYEVKLSNRIELSFDLKFNLIDVDR